MIEIEDCNNFYEILNYLHHHPNSTEATLKIEFKNSVSWILISAVKEDYIGAKNEDGTYLAFENPPFNSTSKTKYFLLSKGEAYIENRKRAMCQWWIPLIISLVSLTISIVSIFVAR